MRLIHGLGGIRKFRRAVVALGVFDGVHRGHRKILKAAVSKAIRNKGTSVVLTFWPHPQEEKTLYSLQHRIRLIDQLGIDVCIVVNFNSKFSRISAANFVKNILSKKIGAEHVFVGKNFRFGSRAEGDCKFLSRLSATYNFKLKIFQVLRVNNKPISSTYIRLLINRGRIKLAEELLAHPVSILGTVVKGSSLGRKMGFPTANINPHHEIIPPNGIYAVWIIIRKRRFRGICYIGSRPTFVNKISKRIEVYIYNFKKKLYGEYLEIQFIQRLRDEQKFDSAPSLVKQIKKDIRKSKSAFFPH
ncbi:MAG: bifunctional riboflavin kinase/FAD synthetase [Candidatus Omnitrophica bacterium]|nr:bifunctional riboflavin kinase/FAD synthetase [Candidatus Omnitrophota bacterium]